MAGEVHSVDERLCCTVFGLVLEKVFHLNQESKRKYVVFVFKCQNNKERLHKTELSSEKSGHSGAFWDKNLGNFCAASGVFCCFCVNKIRNLSPN